MLLESSRWDEAIQVARAYHAEFPNDTAGVWRLAAAISLNGDREAAIACVDASIRASLAGLLCDVDFLAKRQAAITRDMPPILLNTMFKSASMFISEKLCRGLSLPRCYVTLPGIVEDRIIPSALALFSLGGAVCQEHLPADDEILVQLEVAGIDRFVVHVRNPRQTMLSGIHHYAAIMFGTDLKAIDVRSWIPAGFAGWSLEKQVDYYLEERFPDQVAWLAGWHRLAGMEQTGQRVLITTFESFQADPPAFFRQLLDFFEIPAEDFDWTVFDEQLEPGKLHFRKGATREWEQAFTAPQKERARAMMAEAGLGFYLDKD